MSLHREFIQKIGSAMLYRFKDRPRGYRFVLVDGPKERFFDSSKEVEEHFERKGQAISVDATAK
jgi:hypothetical protein